MHRTAMSLTLAWVFVSASTWLAPSGAAAQVVIVDEAGACGGACPPCPPGMVCPPCAPAPGCAGAVDGHVEGEIVLTPRPVPAVPAAVPVPRETPVGATPSGEVTISGGRTTSTAAPPRHVTPSPGVIALGYQGGWDGVSADVYSGGLLRTTAHFTDVYYLEITLGVSGRSQPDRTTLVEVPLLLGFRIMAPIEHQVLRMYGTLATGLMVHTIVERRVGAWVVLPIELGGGLEVGGPVGESMSIGAFFDVRAVARLPFENEPVSIGIGWSSGLGIYWF